MIIGQTIVACTVGGSAQPTVVYTPWIASWGNAGVFPFEIIAIGGSNAQLTGEVFTKNTEQPDPGVSASSAVIGTSVDTFSITDAEDLLELVRVQFTLAFTPEETDCCTTFVHFRPLNPSWITN